MILKDQDALDIPLTLHCPRSKIFCIVLSSATILDSEFAMSVIAFWNVVGVMDHKS